MAKERISLYFNTDIPLERAMWEFISKDGRKSQKIKRVIEDVMNASQFVASKEVKNDVKESYVSDEVEEEIDIDELDGIDL